MRRIPLYATVLLVGLGNLPECVRAQEKLTPHTYKTAPHAEGPRARIAEVAWLAGHWLGEGLGGTTEEVWSPPLGNSMMGMYRLVKNGKVVFSELCFIGEADGSLVLKLKHFDAEFRGWEAKEVALQFPLVKLGPKEAFFDGITFRKGDDSSLQAFVAIHNKKTGQTREEEFRYRLVTGK